MVHAADTRIASVARLFASDLAEAIGRLPGDGLNPSLVPATQRDPSLGRDLRMVLAAATVVPGAVAAGSGGMAARILRKRVVNANQAVATMLRSVADYEVAAQSYNSLAAVKDPALFAGIAGLAREKKSDPSAIVARILNTDDHDPAISALRPRMKALGLDPEMTEQLRRMHELARRFEDRADVVCRMIDRIDGGKPAPGAISAVQRLSDVVSKELAGPVAALPALKAGIPAALGASPDARMASAVSALSARGSALQSRFSAAVGAAMRR